MRVIVAGELPREAHNAPLHLFTASPELIGFGREAYRQRSPDTSALVQQLLERYRGEDNFMSFTMDDFRRWYVRDHFPRLSPQEKQEAFQALSPEQRQKLLESLPLEERLAGASRQEVQEYLERMTAGGTTTQRKSRRKK